MRDPHVPSSGQRRGIHGYIERTGARVYLLRPARHYGQERPFALDQILAIQVAGPSRIALRNRIGELGRKMWHKCRPSDISPEVNTWIRISVEPEEAGHECLNPMRPSPSRRRLSWAPRLATVQSTRVTLVKIDLKTKEQRKPDGHIPPG